jgi:hypothetical protein
VSALAVVTSLALAAGAEGKCVDGLGLPDGVLEWNRAYLPESTPNALEEVKLLARNQLVERLCAGGECEPIKARIIDYKQNAAGGFACAIAAIKREDVEGWREGLTAATVPTQFSEVLIDLFGEPARPGEANAPKAPKGKKAPAPPLKVAVVVGNIEDNNVKGSRRSLWIAAHMEAALAVHGLQVVSAPPGWSGAAVPQGATAMLTGAVLSRREKTRQVFDVTWRADYPDGRSKTSVRMSMLEAIAPPGGAPAEKLATTQVVKLELDDQARLHGAMCNGQRTHLRIKSTEDRCVLVFDTFGNKAMLIFPNEFRADCMVRKGEELNLAGDEGFAVMLAPPIEVEDFVVIAAPSRDALPRVLKDLTGTCLLTKPQLDTVAFKSLEGVDRSQLNFRVLKSSDEACATVEKPDPELFKQAELQLKNLTRCKAEGAR